MKSLRQFITEQLLWEAATKEVYQQQFAKIFKMVNQEDHNKKRIVKWIQHETDKRIDKAIQILKKNNRVQWYMYFIKSVVMEQLTYHRAVSNSDLAPIAEKFKTDLEAKWGKIPHMDSQYMYGVNKDSYYMVATQVVDELLRKIDTYLSYDIPLINNYAFNKWPTQVLEDLDKIEKESFKGYEPFRLIADSDPVEQKNEEIMTFDNGWRWVDLKRTESEDSRGRGFESRQGQSLRDCATCGYNGKTQIQLQEPVTIRNKKYWHPHLRFEIKNDDKIGMSSEFANHKPDKKYNPYVLALLTQDKFPIAGFVMPRNEAGFKMSQFSAKQLKELFAKREDLKSEYYVAVLNKQFDYLRRHVTSRLNIKKFNEALIAAKPDTTWLARQTIRSVPYYKSDLSKVWPFIEAGVKMGAAKVADANDNDRYNNLPASNLLGSALLIGSLELMKLCLSNGAKYSKNDAKNVSVAIERKHNEVVEYYLKNSNFVKSNLDTWLKDAIDSNNEDVIELIIKKGIKIDPKHVLDLIGTYRISYEPFEKLLNKLAVAIPDGLWDEKVKNIIHNKRYMRDYNYNNVYDKLRDLLVKHQEKYKGKTDWPDNDKHEES